MEERIAEVAETAKMITPSSQETVKAIRDGSRVTDSQRLLCKWVLKPGPPLHSKSVYTISLWLGWRNVGCSWINVAMLLTKDEIIIRLRKLTHLVFATVSQKDKKSISYACSEGNHSAPNIKADMAVCANNLLFDTSSRPAARRSMGKIPL